MTPQLYQFSYVFQKCEFYSRVRKISFNPKNVQLLMIMYILNVNNKISLFKIKKKILAEQLRLCASKVYSPLFPPSLSLQLYIINRLLNKLILQDNVCLSEIRLAIRNPSKFWTIFGPRIRIRNSNCGFGLLIFMTFYRT